MDYFAHMSSTGFGGYVIIVLFLSRAMILSFWGEKGGDEFLGLSLPGPVCVMGFMGMAITLLGPLTGWAVTVFAWASFSFSTAMTILISFLLSLLGWELPNEEPSWTYYWALMNLFLWSLAFGGFMVWMFVFHFS